MVTIVLLVASGSSLLVRTTMPARDAVVIPQEVEVFTGPNSAEVVRFKLHAGTEVRVLRTHQWVDDDDGPQELLPLPVGALTRGPSA